MCICNVLNIYNGNRKIVFASWDGEENGIINKVLTKIEFETFYS